jgi:hypothetical protein
MISTSGTGALGATTLLTVPAGGPYIIQGYGTFNPADTTDTTAVEITRNGNIQFTLALSQPEVSQYISCRPGDVLGFFVADPNSYGWAFSFQCYPQGDIAR